MQRQENARTAGRRARQTRKQRRPPATTCDKVVVSTASDRTRHRWRRRPRGYKRRGD